MTVGNPEEEQRCNRFVLRQTQVTAPRSVSRFRSCRITLTQIVIGDHIVCSIFHVTPNSRVLMNAAPGAATRRGQALPLRLLGTSVAPTVKTD